MSLEEPKAPIVRIRKKRVKRKSKDNDIVHLPVRASQQARYSSLTTPPNPQTKGRECCRHCFAGCMKVPFCRLICFRCILPKCYSGTGSDDEGADGKDEGYHSQNRRSSEISPSPEGGAEGGTEAGTEPHEFEMTEMKSECSKLIPPPRSSSNEYRKEPFNHTLDNFDSNKNGEVTYIEVDSVSLSENLNTANIPVGAEVDIATEDTTEIKLDMLERGYEEPLRMGVLDFPILKPLENCQRSENIEDDNSDDSESRIYINESVLGLVCDSQDRGYKGSATSKEDRNYLNIEEAGNVLDVTHSKPTDVIIGQSDKPHEYVNLSPLDTNCTSKTITLSSCDKSVDKGLEMVDKSATILMAVKHEDDILNKINIKHADSATENDHERVNRDHDNVNAKDLLIGKKEKAESCDSDQSSDTEDHAEVVKSDQTRLL